MFFSGGCEPVAPDDTGLDVLPPEDTIGVAHIDSFTVQMATRIVDRVQTGYTTRQLMGNYIDPQLGRISATTYSAFWLPANRKAIFGDPADLRLVSLTLTLDFRESYGRYDSPQRMRVYELADTMPYRLDQTYSDRQPLATKGPELSGGYLIDFRGKGAAEDFSVPLDASLGEKFLFADSTNMKDNEAFEIFFRGLAIGTEPVGFDSREPGAIFYLALASASTNLTLRYQKRNSTTGEFENQVFDFIVDLNTPRFHIFQRTEFDNTLLGQTPTDNGAYSFNQAGALVKNLIRIPALSGLNQAAVNRAELILKVDPAYLGSLSRYAPPARLQLYAANAEGAEARDSQGRIILLSFADYDNRNRQYRFPLSTYTQDVLNDRRQNNGFICMSLDSSYTVERAVFGGTTHPSLKPNFRMVITRLPR